MKQIAKRIIGLTGFELKRINHTDDTPLYIQCYGKDSVKNRRFYNICAGGHLDFGGAFHHPCWTNIDLDRPWFGELEYNPKTDISHDLLSLQPIPVESNSAELVHSRYTVEHINDEAAQVMFKEVHRMLKKGGVFRLACPNVDLDYRAFVNNDRHYFYWIEMFSIKKYYEHLRYRIPLRDATLEQVFLVHFASNASTLHNDGAEKQIGDEEFRELFKTMKLEDALNYCTSRCSIEKHKKYRQNHVNWWNQPKFERMLKEAGFKNVYLSAAEQSVSSVMRHEGYFDNLWNKVAIYMEAVK